jgi:NADH:ubiquinone reductase (H+-translocating)
MLLAFERAERTDDQAERDALLTFVVVGAGPTGVELAGTLAEIAHHTLPREFRRADPSRARVLLVEGGPRVLQTYPEDLSARAQRQLEELEVEVRTGAIVTGIDADGISIGAERIVARTVFWAAGVAASPLTRSLGAPLDRAGRVKVESTLQVPGLPNVFAIGDLIALEQDGHPVPGVAPAAKQMGRHTGRNIARLVRGEPLVPFRYRDQGSLATIGRRRAIALFGKVKLSGRLAWWAWLVIHVFFLIGFRNRFVVLIDWAWAYFTFERHARLVLGRDGPALR